ncbi:hypothetical protein L596_023132 [Steinernema carpocapsae]|uniref:CCR4-Not complex component Not N-terminal domain-containing protein n=1 Tax=Steinernema carpocapsae TaxID=34508 RepID=A0A4V5ZZA7_STECR|nr:hypothetical protein L596_023132 [Steinernema carpocapsae]
MAEKRKLLNEIDKCYKKIDEGVEVFEEIMLKMHEANSDNQREKCQDDLKKEIKKLQRLRDQIKGWQNSSDIKDKDKLIQYRKIIEHRMEQFKDIERENKTKPHSKQGLCAEEKLDPREKEKFETNEWLRTQIKHLEEEKDKAEALVETISSSESGGRKRGKKGDSAKKNENDKRIEELKHQLERIAFHTSKLEVCMRLVDNDSLSSKTVMDCLKDAMETYIESFDPDSDMCPTENDPEDIYEEFSLSSFAVQLSGIHVAGDDEKCSSENGANGSPTPMPKELDESKQRHSSGSGATSSIHRDRPTPHTPLKLTNYGCCGAELSWST